MIRKIQKNDQKEIERVCEIWLKESYRVHNFVADDYKNFWLNKQNDFKKDTNAADGYVYEEDGVIKGFLTMRVGDSYILELFVDSDFRCKGIGTALLDLAKHRRRFLYLHVYVRNIEAINWYLGRGFVIAKIHEHETQDTNQIKYKMVWSKPLSQVNP